MKGFLFDEHLPARIHFAPSLPITHSNSLGVSPTDTAIWNFAKEHDLAIVSKDTDFSDRIIVSSPPPRVIHLKFGNMRKRRFQALLGRVWPRVEELIRSHKLINVYQDRIEAVE